MNSATLRAVLILVFLLAAGCATQQAQRLEITSGDPQDPVAIDEGSASEESIDLGIDLGSGLEVYRFRAEVAAAVGNLKDYFGDRLIVDSFVDQDTEYVIYVTELADSDEAWLESISAGGLGGTVAIAADPSLPRPAGPCLDGSQRARGETTLLVSSGAQTVEASLGHINIGACPGIGKDGEAGLHGDGFFMTLEDAVLSVDSEDLLTIYALGVRTPRLVGGLTVVDEGATSDGYRWEAIAPATPGTHELDLQILWAEGDALYRIRVEVG